MRRLCVLLPILSITLILNAQVENGGNLLNGHEYVDLGLPSGTMWATCNVGATSPEEYGDYFAWGETKPKEIYNRTTYKFYGVYQRYGNSFFTKYNDIDSLYILDDEDDAATANWGKGWRMPTDIEAEELRNNCKHIFTAQNGIPGTLITGPNGNSIFFPAAGYRYGNELYMAGSYIYYWLVTRSSLNRAYFMDGFDDFSDYNMGSRLYGRSVRPVCSIVKE